MRRSKKLQLTLGMLAVATTLLLSQPGVRVARADAESSAEFESFVTHASQDESSATVPGASCSAQVGPAPELAWESTLQLLRQRLQAERVARPETAQPIALNGRGYNQNPSNVALDLRRLQQELSR